MLTWKIKTGLALLMLFTSVQAFSQHRYTHFPWTYDRTVSAGIGAEGTAFTFLGRSGSDVASAYTALAIPLNPIRGAVGGYFNKHLLEDRQLTDWGVGYNLVLPFTATANIRFGVQQNWHSTTLHGVGDARQKTSVHTSTDFSALLRRDHLLAGVSMENALQEELRQYNILIGFRELETYRWLRSSPFMLMQIRPDSEVPEFRFNYTATVLNTLILGGSVYKNSYYSWGANAGLKLFKAVWLTAGADFKQFNTQPDALELGLRLNVGKGRIRSGAEEAALPRRLSKKGL